MIAYTFKDAFDFIVSMSWEKAFRTFWLFFLFDFPRYFLTDIYILLYSAIDRFRSKSREEAFVSELLLKPPLVSVVVPVLNEEGTIEWTVRSLKEQTYKNIEIILVDDGSTDGTPDICQRLKEREGITYHRFRERAGKSAALNYGLSFATGEYVVFVDSDSTFDRKSIFNMMTAFADPKVGAVSGNVKPRNAAKNLLTALQSLEYLFTISVGRRIRAHFRTLPVISGAFGGFRRHLIELESIGGHEPGPGNDSDLTIRVRKLGYRIAFAPRAVCLTNVPERFPSLIKQRWRWDRNLIRNRLKKHKDVFNPFSANFRLADMLSFVDSIFFHVVLAFMTLFYVIDISFNYPRILPFIMMVNFILYFFAEFVEWIIAIILWANRRDMLLVIYLPLFNPYKIILKLFRIIGYLQEILFNYSYYRDGFAPAKVRQRMIRWRFFS